MSLFSIIIDSLTPLDTKVKAMSDEELKYSLLGPYKCAAIAERTRRQEETLRDNAKKALGNVREVMDNIREENM